ncbi:mannose-1-phosphate guanylyltransferase [Malaciobacter mytili]|uniref:Mannose-1-phosphate guanylyltransferase n=1 Tax=Malaciobacter mytili LMG 24559 TaxID=1032238 RepID=A0AAX2AL47_9BACT|nr:CBS domain-containing protein [Malaciobacter mytili]AXH16128.1 mannose-1-phosphate guanylyltransferase/mannose-6-phosphate isomerase [Malaciobacter mytili LMG 24559]RXI40498.1 mannose-1-phosphate guanylyltransferase [Malaciobacter mytili]RXK17028.1 mannose-1-phosphate guanylyltransferase [Malaciobacter mytili LMG 24559]
MRFEEFKIIKSSTILNALKQIDNNKKGFLVVVDEQDKVLGITTEGDIRRKLIKEANLSLEIPYNNDFIKIYEEEDFTLLFDYFKSEKINYIPVISKDLKLKNIISKKQFHVMLLKDMEYNLKHLPKVDENELDFEVFPRPWGFYKSTLLAEHVQSKIITVFPQGELSLQKHKKREEHWIIIKGEGKIILEDSILKVEQGRYVYIPKGCKHKLINSSLKENLILAEVQLGSYFGEDDIIRYEDKYGRIKK